MAEQSCSGGLATRCIRSAEQLELTLALVRPSWESAVLAEDYLHGQEPCMDTIMIANEPLFYPIKAILTYKLP